MGDRKNLAGATETEEVVTETEEVVTETGVVTGTTGVVAAEEEDPSLAPDQGHPEEGEAETEAGPTAAADPAIALGAQYHRRGAGPSPMTETEQMHRIEALNRSRLTSRNKKYLRASSLSKGASLRRCL